MTRPWQQFAFFKCLEHDDCLWIVGGKDVSLYGHLNDYRDFIFFCLNSLTDKYKIYRVSDTMALLEICALQVLLVLCIIPGPATN